MDEETENFSDEDVRNILKDALKMKMEEKRKLPSRVQLNSALKSTITEFLSCFTLIGYDLDGNPITMTIYNTKKDKAALDNAFLEAFGKYMGKKIGSDEI